jgi:hypothetical protein
VTLLALAASAALGGQRGGRYFVVQVVDEQTGRGVPLVELATTDAVRHYTDSNGLIALDEPGLEGREVWFTLRSHGYEAAADGFGFRGVALEVRPGKRAQVKIRRVNIAERLYRITGEGIYRDTVLAGEKPPTEKPLLNARLFGCDSVQNAVYQGKLFWIWGDTSQDAYPLGNFHSTGATSELPGKGGLDPAKGVNLRFFEDSKGFVKGLAPVPGDGPTWLDGLVTVPENGRERLFAAYAKIKNMLEVYERGLVRFNDEKQQFEPVARFPLEAPLIPHGHAERRREGGTEYLYFGNPFPLTRVPAEASAISDLSRYEGYTCLLPGSTPEAPKVERDAAGKLRYAWRREARPLTPELQETLIKKGVLRREEALSQITDPANGKPVVIHSGTVCWNAYRKRWVMIAVELGGTSQVGEVWYSEADTAQGPWRAGRKIVTHDRYSFYNPAQHPEFDQQGGRFIYFEGTYTHTFSGNSEQTPRYEYNQMMYRLDLADPRLKLPESSR